MSNLIERAKMVVPREELRSYFVAHNILDRAGMVAVTEIATLMADFAQSERTRIADELEALSQKTPPDAMVTALLDYADKLRKND